MANKNTRVEARNPQGNELRVSHTELDSPVLDVNALERLHQFRPDIVDFVIEQTRAEAENRRKLEKKNRLTDFHRADERHPAGGGRLCRRYLRCYPGSQPWLRKTLADHCDKLHRHPRRRLSVAAKITPLDIPYPVADGVFHAISHGIACVRPLQSPPL